MLFQLVTIAHNFFSMLIKSQKLKFE